jgi:chorismate mutase
METRRLFGIRGATTADSNTPEAIDTCTTELTQKILKDNNIAKEDIVQVIYTVSPDITADYPAKYARVRLDWDDVPMICAQEIDVKESPKYCIRILITAYLETTKDKIIPVYIKGAEKLRPDLTK